MAEKAHARDKRQSVVAKLLLRTMLMKAPVAFYPLFLPKYNLGYYYISRLFYQSLIVLQQSPY